MKYHQGSKYWWCLCQCQVVPDALWTSSLISPPPRTATSPWLSPWPWPRHKLNVKDEYQKLFILFLLLVLGLRWLQYCTVDVEVMEWSNCTLTQSRAGPNQLSWKCPFWAPRVEEIPIQNVWEIRGPCISYGSPQTFPIYPYKMYEIWGPYVL